jgi:hypothetical protein
MESILGIRTLQYEKKTNEMMKYYNVKKCNEVQPNNSFLESKGPTIYYTAIEIFMGKKFI